jgi:hypothetical protein
MPTFAAKNAAKMGHPVVPDTTDVGEAVMVGALEILWGGGDLGWGWFVYALIIGNQTYRGKSSWQLFCFGGRP